MSLEDNLRVITCADRFKPETPPNRGFLQCSDEDEFCDDGEWHKYIDGNCIKCGKER